MYKKIADDIKQESYAHYDNDGQRFVIWYLRNIYMLDPIQADECLTDGPNDKQIDAVFIDDAKSVIHIIQGKFYANSAISSVQVREVLSSWELIKNLSELQREANTKLKGKIKDIADALEDDYEIIFELISPSDITDSAQNDLAIFRKSMAESENLSAVLQVVDNENLKLRYDEALQITRPYINHTFTIEQGKYVDLNLDGIKAFIVALPLSDCIKVPGINDGGLFRKNVRQSLGLNKINKGIAKTLKDDIGDFFFFHNGITAICSSYELKGNILEVKDLNVVNGCQSLTTISTYSETVRKSEHGYILFRFYEIADTKKADDISVFTNSQTAVKARDLRSNHKNVLAMKRAYQERYTDGYFITKRGEKTDSQYNSNHIISLDLLGKQLMAWHSQRPTISYSETKIFDKYFDIFKKDYDPENMQALNELYKAIIDKWSQDNPLEFEPALLAMKSYAPYHHLYAISVLVSQVNGMHELVPNPKKVLSKLAQNDLLDKVVRFAGLCLNTAFVRAISEAREGNKTFSPQNWTKNKGSLNNIREAINYVYSFGPAIGNTELFEELKEKLKLEKSDFETRWTAD